MANLLNRSHDVGVSAAAADVAAHEFLDGCIVWTTRFFEQRYSRHDLARRAVAALVTVLRNKRGLHRVQRFWSTQAFNRGDLLAVE